LADQRHYLTLTLHGLPGALDIPMESFTRAVEIVLKDSELRDGAGYRWPDD
jgi:hypothetical protein